MFGQNLKSLTLTKHRMQGNPDGGNIHLTYCEGTIWKHNVENVVHHTIDRTTQLIFIFIVGGVLIIQSQHILCQKVCFASPHALHSGTVRLLWQYRMFGLQIEQTINI
jgi:hypothetical protein